MYASIIVLATAISAVLAAPPKLDSRLDGHSVGDAASQCGNYQKLSCCNKSSGDSSDGLVGLNSLLGGSCSMIPVNVLGVQVPINQACTDTVACCDGDQTGLLNLQCTPITV